VASQTDVFEEHVATPTGLDVAAAATAYGARHVPVGSLDELRAGLEAAEGTTILHVRTDRAENVALHRRVWEAVARR
jgi:2-succinyl-5-enolpyruvyl-6-hydroxy-3-cyclohexene-1-carboxylate synthase